MSSTCYNPLLYAWHNETFRHLSLSLLLTAVARTSSVISNLRESTLRFHHSMTSGPLSRNSPKLRPIFRCLVTGETILQRGNSCVLPTSPRATVSEKRRQWKKQGYSGKRGNPQPPTGRMKNLQAFPNEGSKAGMIMVR